MNGKKRIISEGINTLPNGASYVVLSNFEATKTVPNSEWLAFASERMFNYYMKEINSHFVFIDANGHKYLLCQSNDNGAPQQVFAEGNVPISVESFYAKTGLTKEDMVPIFNTWRDENGIDAEADLSYSGYGSDSDEDEEDEIDWSEMGEFPDGK